MNPKSSRLAKTLGMYFTKAPLPWIHCNTLKFAPSEIRLKMISLCIFVLMKHRKIIIFHSIKIHHRVNNLIDAFMLVHVFYCDAWF